MRGMCASNVPWIGSRTSATGRDRHGGAAARAKEPKVPERHISAASAGILQGVFLFFSNRLGLLGSLLASLAATAVLLLLLGVIRL
jgi:hypothetical protein